MRTLSRHQRNERVVTIALLEVFYTRKAPRRTYFFSLSNFAHSRASRLCLRMISWARSKAA